MNADTLKAVAELIKAVAWSLGIVGAVAIAAWALRHLFKSGNPFQVKVGNILDVGMQAKPAEVSTPPPPSPETTAMMATAGADAAGAPTMSNVRPAGDGPDELPALAPDAPLPSDYLYLVHTSFLRPQMQAEFQRRTGVLLPHYDIRVKLDSYYRGGLDRVSYVEYVLHTSFPDPIQRRYGAADNFELKEVANGEFVLAANVYLKDLKHPLVLQRYITLWPAGPRI
ncbi:MAG: hypothetical protein IT438_15000 [Phycisphaerales bacterium]|nr:hypothetical protein [Phycisphaerales bacterium]